jgi:hypothetical protein
MCLHLHDSNLVVPRLSCAFVALLLLYRASRGWVTLHVLLLVC